MRALHAACPVYQQVLIEAANPRGRIQLVKYFLEGKVPLTKRFKEIIPDLPSLRDLHSKLSERRQA